MRACKECDAILACKYTFGAFWKDKSNGGEGCNRPIEDDHKERIYDVIFQRRKFKPIQMEMEIK